MSDCCEKSNPKSSQFHLVILGGGSAAFAASIRATELGARVTIINAGLPIGGTCVNVGCVPSKTLIRAAEVNYKANHHNFVGIESQSKVTSFSEVIQQKRSLVEQLRQAKYLDVVSDLPDVKIINGWGKLIAPDMIEVDGQRISADSIIVAAGATTNIVPIPGLDQIDYLTNESAFELDKLPESLIVLGGRYIALECAQMFARLGSNVTVLQRSSRILPTESEDVTSALTGYLANEGMEIVTGVSLKGISRTNQGVCVEAMVDGLQREFTASYILVATGRKPNTVGFGLQELGATLDKRGFLTVDGTLRTNIKGIFGAGDVIGEPMFVYTAAYEGALAAENAISGQSRKQDYTALPWVIFTDPQVAGVGLDEQQALNEGVDADITVLPLSHVPRAIAARDTRGLIKLIRNRATDKLIGARILAPEGSELLMEVALAIKYGIIVKELAKSFHPYLTLSEAIKLAALTFNKDVAKLSCCAT